jgi:hypothetical protein
MTEGVEMRAECRNCNGALEPSHLGPCPHCGEEAGKNVYVTATTKVEVAPSMSKTVEKTLTATAKGQASMSKAVGKTLSVVSKGLPSLEATWEEWQELRKRHYGWTAVEVGLTFGSPVVGYFVGDTTGMLVGVLTGAGAWWVGPKAVRTVPERVRKSLRIEGE